MAGVRLLPGGGRVAAGIGGGYRVDWLLREFCGACYPPCRRQAAPPGVVSEERAAWLLARVDECKSVEALAAMVNVLAEAHSVPQRFLAAAKERAAGWSGAGAARRA